MRGPPPTPARRSGRPGEEISQRPVGVLRCFFRQEMAAIDGAAGNVFGMVAPDGEDVVAAALGTALAPQHQQRHREAVASICAIMDEVDRGTRAVFIASRPDRLGILEAPEIFGERLWLQFCRLAQQCAELVAEKELALGADQPLRESARLNQKKPMPARCSGLLIDRLETVERWHNVEQRQTLNPPGVIAREPVRDSRASIVAGNREPLEAERRHRLDLILRKRTLRIIRVVGPRGRL